jgi:hypothetical protein
MRSLWLLVLAGCGNEPPSPALVHIEPEAPDTTHDLRVVVEEDALDLDKDDLTYRYVWSLEGVVQDDLTTDTVPADRTTRDDLWRVEVYADDGKAEGPAAVAEVSVGNAPPVATAALDPERPQSGVPVRCAMTALDPDMEDLLYTYQWFVNNSGVSVEETLQPTYFQRGDTVRCQATPYDGEAYGEEVSSPSAEVDNAAPVMTSVTISPTSPTREMTLVASVAATDADDDPITYTYAWKVAGDVIGINSSLPGTAVSRGDEVTVEVIPSDPQGPGTVMASAPVTVEDSPTRITAVTLSPTTVYTNDTITATLEGVVDADSDSPTFTYVWSADGVVVQSSTSNTLPGSLFSKNDLVEVSVTGDAGYGAGPATSASVTISNSAPSITTASLDETSLRESSDVRCSGGGFTDADGDSAANRYAWYVDGALVTFTGRDLDGTYFDKNQDVYCVVTAHDGTTAGNSLTTTSISVVNTPPGSPYVTLRPGRDASLSDDLECEVTTPSVDDDGDTITYTYAWTRDGAALSTASGTIPSADLVEGSTYECEVTPYDDEEAGFPSSGGPTTVYQIAGDLSLADADVTITGDGGNDYFGAGLAGGDWNGDGDDDLLVSHAGYADEVWVFHGPLSDGAASTADLRITPATMMSGWGLGRSASSAGDFDGDGAEDLVVGMPYDNSISSQNGGAWIFTGSPTGAVTTDAATTRFRAATGGAQAGFAVAGPGDLDGDGWDDVIVTAPWEDETLAGRNDSGAVYFVLGSDTPPTDVQPATVDAVLYGKNGGDNCGYSIASPGDVDGDGYANVIVGCINADGIASRSGLAYVLDGPVSWTSGTISTYAVATLAGGVNYEYMGYRVGAPGDVDGDGRGDLLVMASNGDNGSIADTGLTYLVLSPASGTIPLTTAADASFAGTASGDMFGHGMAGLPDLDGDGSRELVFGAYGDDVGTSSNLGGVGLFYGPHSGANDADDALAWFSGEKTGDQAGWTVASPGDYDGDGADDLVVSATGYDFSSTYDAGVVYVISTGP